MSISVSESNNIAERFAVLEDHVNRLYDRITDLTDQIAALDRLSSKSKKQSGENPDG